MGREKGHKSSRFRLQKGFLVLVFLLKVHCHERDFVFSHFFLLMYPTDISKYFNKRSISLSFCGRNFGDSVYSMGATPSDFSSSPHLFAQQV